jgi:rare lipoprotein A (peptidoglycan hydrolase)
MKIPLTIGSLVAVLVLSGGAAASQLPVSNNGDKTIPTRQDRSDTPMAETIVQVVDVTQEVARVASATVVAPFAAAIGPGATSAPAPAKNPIAPPKRASASTGVAKAKRAGDGKRASRSSDKRRPDARHEAISAARPKPLCVRAVGRAQTGTAAWYGGRYIGRRTSSGERLDTIHATAAHRTLPLNSLARVTNLDNGRSVIVRVTDRGPVASSLLIDMSPRAAAELHMEDAGLALVRVEQVVEVPPDTK